MPAALLTGARERGFSTVVRRALALLPLLTVLGCALSGAPAGAPAPAPRVPAIVEMVATNHVALFYGEREMLRRTVADHLRRSSKLNLQPLSDLELEVLRARLAKDATECGAPTPRAEALAAAHPDALYVRATASCIESPCTLRARVSRPPTDHAGAWSVLERWQAPVADPTSANAWVNAVGDLKPAPEPAGGGLLLGKLSQSDPSRPSVEVLGVSSVHPWTTAPTLTMIAPAQAALDACHAPGWTSAGTDHVAVEVAPNGAVARCEGDSHAADEGPERMRCVCKALGRLRFEAGPRGRRLEVRLINHPGAAGPKQPLRARLETVDAGAGYAPRAGLKRLAPALEACSAEPPVEPRALQVELTLDGAGRVTAATADATGLDADFIACAKRAAAQLGLPCPPARAARTVKATYRISAR